MTLATGSSARRLSALSSVAWGVAIPTAMAACGQNGRPILDGEPSRPPLILELSCPNAPVPKTMEGCVAYDEMPDCQLTIRNAGRRNVYIQPGWDGGVPVPLSYEVRTASGSLVPRAPGLGESFGAPMRLEPGQAETLRTFIFGKFELEPGQHRLRAIYDPNIFEDEDEDDEGDPWHPPGARYYSNWQTIEKRRHYDWCEEDLGPAPQPRSKPRRNPRCDDPSLDEVDRLLVPGC
jgi:hypothetical protein